MTSLSSFTPLYAILNINYSILNNNNNYDAYSSAFMFYLLYYFAVMHCLLSKPLSKKSVEESKHEIQLQQIVNIF